MLCPAHTVVYLKSSEEAACRNYNLMRDRMKQKAVDAERQKERHRQRQRQRQEERHRKRLNKTVNYFCDID